MYTPNYDQLTLNTIQEKVSHLKDSLLNSLPSLPSLLRDIHTQLKNNPDVVTLISDAEISIILSSLETVSQNKILTSTPKKGKKKQEIDLSDI